MHPQANDHSNDSHVASGDEGTPAMDDMGAINDLCAQLARDGWREIESTSRMKVQSAIDTAFAPSGELWTYTGKACDSASAPPAKNQRNLKYRLLWAWYYVCHRAGTKRVSRANTSPTAKRRIRKPSKKCGCKGRLTVRCYEILPTKAFYKVTNGHTNHTPGTDEDIRSLPPSKRMRS